MPDRSDERSGFSGLRVSSLAIFALIFTVVWLLHIALLQLPYFWDEAGYYIPAARDLWLKGQLIPSSTLSSGHPPLVMAWLAAWWKLSGSTPAVTRTAMLLLSAFGLMGVFRLAKQVSTTSVAVAATALTAIYPVWFAQSSLAHLDVAAAAFTFWGLDFYLRERRSAAVLFFALGALAKETAVVAPLALFAYEIIAPVVMGYLSRGNNRQTNEVLPFSRPSWVKSVALLASALPLAAWFLFHRARTGVFFGNPEFFRYNLAATADPLRIPLAMLQRLWHAFGYLNLFVLVLAAVAAMYLPAVRDNNGERTRIPFSVQAIFALIVAVYVLMLSVLGGAVIARYMLPVVPLVIIVCVSTLRRRFRGWEWVSVAVGATFVLALFVNPPYRISPEDNLTYVDFVRLHQGAAKVLQTRYPSSTILTAWPASDELTRPWLRYVNTPLQVVRIDNFSYPQVQLASELSGRYQIAYLFSTKLEPSSPILAGGLWMKLQERFFDYHRDLPPDVAAEMLGGRMVYQQRRGGEWVAIVAIEQVQNARLQN